MGFICVLKIDKTCSLNDSVSNAVEEKLFIPRGQYEKFSAMKNGAGGSLIEEW